MSDLIVRSVIFDENTVEMTFMVLPDDMRQVAGHMLMQSRTFVVHRRGEAYQDEIAELVEAASALVADVLDDWPDAPVAITDDDEDLDEDLGMGQASYPAQQRVPTGTGEDTR